MRGFVNAGRRNVAGLSFPALISETEVENLGSFFVKGHPMMRMLFVLLIAVFPTCVVAADGPPKGKWTIASGVRFSEGGGVAEVEKGNPFIGKTIRFSAHAVEGPAPFGCNDAAYIWSDVPAEGFFQGFAENAEKAATNARLVQLPDPARTLGVTCDKGIFDYHLRDENTMLIMLDLVVYTFERPK
ncbi:hypothetical protein ASG68_20510 [Rhizobium sp. Leaf453]|nr:hypothetical protein ASG42_16650 [Rhizobium sp. Leaf391]KQT00644.1 hypothetical protein ASG50_19635 [Rhizobium sp. Leaf386]KQU09117.1 hypothetical protein ASG68_20510 [Rhizobium sp. Leaf453]